MSKMIVALLAGALSMGAAAVNAQSSFSPRLTTPRIAPISSEGRTPEQQQMLAHRPDYNIYKTLAHHPTLYARWSGLGQYLLNQSTLPARDREIVILRMGWLCQAPYEWAQHARIAKESAQMTDAEIRRIAQGPQAAGWTDFERTLISMVDELRYDAIISDRTWNALRAHYSLEQAIDALYTAAQYQLVSMALNTLGVQLDPTLQERLPSDLPLPPLAKRPTAPRLRTPRVNPIPLDQLNAAARELVAPRIRAGQLPNLYATLIVHPKLYGPRANFGSYIQRESRLPPRARELLILRTGWIMNTEYEWAHHVPIAQQVGLSAAEIARVAQGPEAKGWSEVDAALLRAVDELRREAFMSDVTWTTLAKHFDTAQMIEIIYTTGGYAMTALAINSLGIQVEPGYPAMPKH